MSSLGGPETRFSISIEPDEAGYVGRECPSQECLGYFKVTPGTGLSGQPDCHCPYCGHAAEHNQYFTRAQIEYAKSVALNAVTGALLKDLKRLEFESKPHGAFGIGLSMKVSGRPTPIRYYREEGLETEIICEACSLRYAIYGVFGYCPDCGVHNSLQILAKNLELIGRMLDLAQSEGESVGQAIVANALEDAVAAFDGFGREISRVYGAKATDPAQVGRISFQNLARARRKVEQLFGIDIGVGLGSEEWSLCLRCFQKRHLLAHRLGVVDAEYLRAADDATAMVGRKIRIGSDEVRMLVGALAMLGTYLHDQLKS